MTSSLITHYYANFNTGDRDAMLRLLSADVTHDQNQGGREIGRDVFRLFMLRMDRCYRERLSNIVICTDATGTYASAEYVVHGTYIANDDGLPPATGQKYVLPGGAFFSVRDGLITRVSNYYNLNEWLRQIG